MLKTLRNNLAIQAERLDHVRKSCLSAVNTALPLAAILVFTAGCRDTVDTISCPAVVAPAVDVEVRDARTGAPLAQGVEGSVRDGTFVDALKPYRGVSADPATLVSLQAAAGRPGTYTILVERTGYLPWTVTGVKVTKRECGVETVLVHANLVPQ